MTTGVQVGPYCAIDMQHALDMLNSNAAYSHEGGQLVQYAGGNSTITTMVIQMSNPGNVVVGPSFVLPSCENYTGAAYESISMGLPIPDPTQLSAEFGAGFAVMAFPMLLILGGKLILKSLQ